MQICDEKKCSGCRACACVCPIKCITFKDDNEGFLKPVINNEECIHCNICMQVCPVNISYAERNENCEVNSYSYIYPKNHILMKSTSGGIFSALAEEIIKQGGRVFGAVYDENFCVVQKEIALISELDAMRGSKYVECDTVNSYDKVKEALNLNYRVLYTGLPCQIAGLYATLHKADCSQLYTMELLCHGVPSKNLFQSYIAYLNKKYGEVLCYSFRDKKKWKWGNWGSFKYKKGNSIKTKNFVVASDYYYSLFFKENCFRESCYNCKYASLPRIADITVGDFWGIENIRPYHEIENGVSLVITNNQQGEKLVRSAVDDKHLEHVDLENAKELNSTIIRGTSRPDTRNEFYQCFKEHDFLYTAKRYVRIRKLIPILARYVPRNLKNILKSWFRH